MGGRRALARRRARRPAALGGDWSQGGPEIEAFRLLARRLSFAPGVGLPGLVWSTGEAVWMEDIATDESSPRMEAARQADLHAAVGLPIFGPAGFLGVMGLFGSAARERDPDRLEGMQRAARQTGVYLARVRAERRLAATEAITGSIFEAALDCIITMDADGRVLDLNPAAAATFGYARDEARGALLADLVIPEEFRAAHQRALRRYVETRQPRILDRRLELVASRADGSRLPVELTVTRLGDQEPPTFAGFLRDVTAGRESEVRVAALLEREHRARIRAEIAERSARRVSEVLQHSLLPPHLPRIPGIEIAAAYAAVAEGSLVGGDFYDVFPVADDRWGIVIGDVSGKGAEAASLTALIRYTLRAAAARERTPETVLSIVNAALLGEPRENAYCTLLYARVGVEDSRPLLELAVAGHPLPLVVRGDGSTRTIGRPGTLLGASAQPSFAAERAVLGDDETLLMYTDGVTETRTPSGLLGLEGLAAVIRTCVDHRPGALVAAVAAGVRGTAGHRVTDDIALLALRGVADRGPA